METTFTIIGALVSGVVVGIILGYAFIGTVCAIKAIARNHFDVWVVASLAAISALCANVALLIHMLA